MTASLENLQAHDVTISQLARLGDVAQTLPLIQRFSAGTRIRFVCDAATEAWVKLLPGIEHIVPVDTQKWRGLSIESLHDFPRLLADLRTEISALSIDNSGVYLALNEHPLSDALAAWACPDAASRWVTSRLALVRGYIRLIAQLHSWNRIHLADLWASLAGHWESVEFKPIQPTARAKQFSETVLQVSRRNRNRPTWALVLGSGSVNRQIEPETYVSWIAELPADRRPGVVLIGGHGDAALVQRFLRAASGRFFGVMNLVGQCTPGELLGVLTDVDLVIGVDTGPLHWAAGVGTRVLGLYFGEAGFHDTGPYGDCHFVLTPDCSEYPCHPQRAKQCGWRCRQAYRDANVMAALLTAILEGSSEIISSSEPGLRLHRSQLTPAGIVYRAAHGEDDADEFQACAQYARQALGYSGGSEDALQNEQPGKSADNLELFSQVWTREIEQLRFPSSVPASIQASAQSSAIKRLRHVKQTFIAHEHPAAERQLFPAQPATLGV